MKCVKCNKDAEISLPNLNACRKCFEKIIEKRVRKEIRINVLIEKNDKLLFIDDGSAESKVSDYLVKKIIKGLPVSCASKKLKYTLGKKIAGDFSKAVIPWNTDKEGDYLLSGVFENKKIKFLGNFTIGGKTYIKPLLHVLHEEAVLFARGKGFEFSEEKIAPGMLEELEKEYPEIKFSLMKSAEEIAKFK